MEEDKRQHNQNGQTPSDHPSEKLIHPPSKKDGKKKENKPSGFNTTAKDPLLGKRNTSGR